MEQLKKHVPILWSEKFWGIVATSVLIQLSSMGIGAPELISFLTTTVAGATTVGVIDSAAKKINKK